MGEGVKILAAAGPGWSSSKVLGDLPELVTGRSQVPTYDRHVFFRSIGLGLEDIAMAHALHRLVTAEGVDRGRLAQPGSSIEDST